MKTTPNDITLKEQALRELALDEFAKHPKGYLPPFVRDVYVVDVIHKATQRVCCELVITYYDWSIPYQQISDEAEVPDVDELLNEIGISEINLTNFEVLIEAQGKEYYV